MAFVAHLHNVPPAAVVEVDGELDMHTVRHVEQAVEQAVADGCVSVSVDLGGVPFMDWAALAALIGADRRVRESGGQLVVVAAAPQVRWLLDVTGSTRLLGSLSAAGA